MIIINNRNHLLMFLFLITIISCNKEEPSDLIESETEETMKGIDASFIPELRELNEKVYDNNSDEVDFLDLIKASGMNTVRLRIWHSPENQHSSLSEVKTFSEEIKSKNLKTYLNFHYSDTWADPGHQDIPSAWTELAFDQLKDSVLNYTKSVINEIKPDYVQLGNEINNGILFPLGNINNLNQLRELILQGINAVREESPETMIILHYAGHYKSADFFDLIKDLDFDIIALSYYPYWHGKDMGALKIMLNELSEQYDKRIIIAETAYPFAVLEGTEDFTVGGYPATAEGQVDFIKKIYSYVKDISHGYGVCLWGGVTNAYVTPKPTTNGYYWENQAVLDYNNNFLPVLEALNE